MRNLWNVSQGFSCRCLGKIYLQSGPISPDRSRVGWNISTFRSGEKTQGNLDLGALHPKRTTIFLMKLWISKWNSDSLIVDIPILMPSEPTFPFLVFRSGHLETSLLRLLSPASGFLSSSLTRRGDAGGVWKKHKRRDWCFFHERRVSF